MPARRSGPRSRRARPDGPPGAPAATGGEPSLSRERIAAGAVDLLDAEGLGGFTMRRLADRLGCGVMSLYWHVDDKEDALDAALDAVLAPRAAPDAEAAGWRDEVARLLEDWRAAMLRHPWSVSLLPRRALGPGMLDRLERLARTLSGAGVPDAGLNAAIWSLWNHVVGATVTRASFGPSPEDRAAAQRRLAEPGGHPTLERTGLLLDDDWDGAFRRGLDLLLDGLAPNGPRRDSPDPPV